MSPRDTYQLLTIALLTTTLYSCQESQSLTKSSDPVSKSSSFSESYDTTCGELELSYLVGDWEDSNHDIVVSIQDGNCAATVVGSPAGINGFSSFVYSLSQEKMSEYNNLYGTHDFKWGQQAAQMSNSNTVMNIGGKALSKR